MRFNFNWKDFFAKIYEKTILVLKCRHFWFLLIIYATLIPRFSNVAGNDGFEILWMAKALANGLSSSNTWLIHPLSFFGFYPFSFYPIGYPFIISLFLRAGFSAQFTVTILSFFFMTLFYIGAVLLSKKVTKEGIFQDLFVVSLVYAPVFLKFIYNTFGSRGPLMAVSSYIFMIVYSKLGNKNRKKIILTILVLLSLITISAFIHRIWLVYIGVLLVFIFALLISKISTLRNLFVKIIRKKILFISIYLILIIVCAYLGYSLFGVDFRKIESPWFSNSSIFGLLINIIIDYGLRIGLISIFFPIGVFFSIKTILDTGSLTSDENKKSDYSSSLNLDEDFIFRSVIDLFFILALVLVWTYTTYSTVIFLPVYILFSIKGLIEMTKRIKFLYIIITLNVFTIIFLFLYQFLIISVLPYIILYVSITFALSLIVILVFLIDKKDYSKNLKLVKLLRKLNSKKNILLLVIPMMIFSTLVNDSLILHSEIEFPYSYISDEEISVINFLKESGIDGIIYVSHPQVSRTLSGYGFLPTINGYHSAHQLYYRWINPITVKENTILGFLNLTINPDGNYQLESYENMLLSAVSQINASSVEGLNSLINLHIQYSVILKNSSGLLDPNHYTNYGRVYSSFIISLKDLVIAFETQHMFVWKFY